MSQNIAYVVPVTYNNDVGRAYADKYFGLGVAQIILGVLSIILGIASVAYVNDYVSRYYFSGTIFLAASGSGIWCGAFFVISGLLGVVSGKKPQHCPIVAAMVMTIFSALAACTLLGYQVTISAAAGNDARLIRNSRYRSSGIVVLDFLDTVNGLHATTAVFAFAALIISIVHSAYCCAATCCRSGSNQQHMTMNVIHQAPAVVQQPHVGTQPGQQVFVQQYPIAQQGSTQPPMYSQQVPTALPPGQHTFGVAQGQQGIPEQQQPMNYAAENALPEKTPIDS